MSFSRPLIGITAGYSYSEGYLFVKDGYYNGIIEAGGIPVALPFTQDTDLLDAILERCDGILLSGGPDLDARLFGEDNLPSNGEISPCRDFLEIHIAKKAIEGNKPVLGVCRGIQVMNVAMGGSIYQDIHSQIKNREILKHSQNAPKWYPTHIVKLEEGTRLRECFGIGNLDVNSFHHQAVKDAAPGFKVTSTAHDGIIEAIEFSCNKFAVGVQWHPELMWQKDDRHLRLFEELVKAACCG